MGWVASKCTNKHEYQNNSLETEIQLTVYVTIESNNETMQVLKDCFVAHPNNS